MCNGYTFEGCISHGGRGSHGKVGPSRKSSAASARTAGHRLLLRTWGNPALQQFNSVPWADLDINRWKKSALRRRVADDPAQGSQRNSRRREAAGLCLSHLPPLKGKRMQGLRDFIN